MYVCMYIYIFLEMRHTFPVCTSKEARLREKKVAFKCGTQERMETQTDTGRMRREDREMDKERTTMER